MADVVSAFLSAIDDELPRIIERLRRVQMLCRPALDVIRDWDSPDTLYYLDPPYLAETRSSKKVYAVEMTDQDHRELSAVLAGVQGKVVLSGYPSTLYDELYAGWRTVESEIANHAAGGATKARKIEKLWMNWTPTNEEIHPRPTDPLFDACGIDEADGLTPRVNDDEVEE
jgi:DNA adenine methylase